MNTKKIIRISSIIIIILIVVLVVVKKTGKKTYVTVETEQVQQGNIHNSITATGTLQALKTVAVGTQVSGTIQKIHVDFNDKVSRGQILAELDKTALQASLDNARASLDEAKSQVSYQKASYTRTHALYTKELLSKAEYELAEFNLQRAESALKNAESNYERAAINLSYATIYSPIDGVVLNSAVDEGQTVAASFNTPTLFSIANNLTHMQVEAKVDEADIGLVQTGQYVVFTVDAFPDLEFDGTVTQIRFEPVIVSNVVTYTVIIEAENPNLQLMPGMTANIEVFVQKAENTLFIPYKAMRFKPNQSVLDLYYEQFPEAKMTSAQQKTHNTTNTVWVKNNNSIQEVEVTTGINNGVDIEVLKGLDKDDQVIVNMSITEKKSKQSNSSTTSPFMPQRGRRR